MNGKLYPRFQVLERSDMDCVAIRSKKLYVRTIAAAKVFIDTNMKNIYGRKIFFKECQTTDMKIELKDLISVCGSTRNICVVLDDYTGVKTSFFRAKGDKRVPCEIHRIKRAYLAARADLGIEEVNNILYT